MLVIAYRIQGLKINLPERLLNCRSSAITSTVESSSSASIPSQLPSSEIIASDLENLDVNMGNLATFNASSYRIKPWNYWNFDATSSMVSTTLLRLRYE